MIYGPEGIGKSTFAARFPGAVFIDTEGSTNDMDVARLPRPTSWNMLFDEIEYIKTHTDECRTLVIDTIDWAELLCVEHICAVHNKKGIEDFGYGNGYVYTKEEFGRFLSIGAEEVNGKVKMNWNIVPRATGRAIIEQRADRKDPSKKYNHVKKFLPKAKKEYKAGSF